jgi:hypothetical protein
MTPSQSAIDGVDYVADVYGSFADASSLSSLPAVDVDAVAVVADFGIDAEDSTVYDNDVEGGYTESDADIAATISNAATFDLSVMVRPLIDFLPSNYIDGNGQPNPDNGPYAAGEFRSYYNPTDVAAFFASYQSMIVDQAKLAQANGAGLFCIGTELDQLTGPAYESYWTNIITAVRAVFSGKLTYSADWDDALSPWQYGGSGLPAGTGDITTQISFWKQLDYVGIDEYAPISDVADPTLAQLMAGWTQVPTDPTTLAVTGNQSLISYYQGVAATLGMPLLFTELGYANSSDAASSPATPGYDEDGNADGATADPTLQAALYQAYFDAWRQDGDGALAGTYIWNWEPSGDDNNSDFSPQGLPAQTQLADGYAACYAAGTRIRTARGEVPVEALRVGDLAVTSSGACRPIIWIGSRALDAAFLTEHPDMRPVRILAGAFGAGVPARALLLSPGHPVLVDADNAGGVLVPIMCLINGTSVARATVADITYWHVELDRHDLLLAEGLAAESFLDHGMRAWFDQGAGRALSWSGDRCRPVAMDGEPVVAERRRLDALFAVRLETDCQWPRPGADPIGATAACEPPLRRLSLDEFLRHRAADRRLARLTHDIILPVARGLEFGADRPTPLPEGVRVDYIDNAPGGPGGTYNFAIASQVAQRVPNLFGWFAAIFDALAVGGVLNLSIPDHRFGTDGDCWRFSPLSFLALIEEASRLARFAFVVSQFCATEPGGCEFFVCLRRDAEANPARLRSKQLDAIGYVRGLAQRRSSRTKAAPSAPGPVPPAGRAAAVQIITPSVTT